MAESTATSPEPTAAAAPKSAADSNAQFINFTEDFRRAKRNSLAWSAITILVAFAPKWSDEATIASMKLGYPQAGLAFLLWFAALFFFLSFLRAKATLKTLNSEAARESEAVWHDVKQTLVGWSTRLKDRDAAINNLFATGKHFKLMQDKLEQQISEMPFHWKDQADSSFSSALMEFGEPTFRNDPDFTKFYMAVNAFWSDWRLQFFDYVGNASAAILADFKRQEDAYEASRSAYLKANHMSAEAIDRLQESLSDFRQAISSSEKNWHFGLDIFTTYAACFIATFGMVARLGLSDMLDTAMGRVFG